MKYPALRYAGSFAVVLLAATLWLLAGQRAANASTPTPEHPVAPVQDTIDLRRVGYDRGSPDAPVVVIEFADFGCPYCRSFTQSTYPALHQEFVKTGRVRWKYVPFVMGTFPNGAEAARAAECAAEQDAFWPMHDLLFQRQREWKESRRPATLFPGYAAALRLDQVRFATCYREDRGGARTERNNRLSLLLGIRATPSFLVNGRLVEGALPLEVFRQLLDATAARR